MPSYAFTDFDRTIDQLHELMDGWAEAGIFSDVLGEEGMHVFRLVVHEWVANLLQHATYAQERKLVLTVWQDGDALRCSVEDTSLGFDMLGQVEHQRDVLDAPAPSERGRGLLMLVTCAEDLEFRMAADGVRQRIAFALRDPVRGNLAKFFRPADLLPDADLLFEDGFAPNAGAPSGAERGNGSIVDSDLVVPVPLSGAPGTSRPTA